MDNRSHERYIFIAPVALRHFNCDADIKATLINYSKSGLCLRSNIRFRTNSVVMVRILAENLMHTPRKIQEGFRSVTVAEVKWWKELNGENGFLLEYGLKYYN